RQGRSPQTARPKGPRSFFGKQKASSDPDCQAIVKTPVQEQDFPSQFKFCRSASKQTKTKVMILIQSA
ncbi:hypothetical protein, partial [Roseibium album]|uniref:hypothetical protein n=1 Tax=Roseibium album TaxID=311410 RepID=UPI001AD8AEE9